MRRFIGGMIVVGGLVLGGCGDETTEECPPVCEESICGDGVVGADEACDDGNTDSGDYCSATCDAVSGACGDGAVQANEVCDDGENNGGGEGYCTAECQDWVVPAGMVLVPPGEFVYGPSGETEVVAVDVFFIDIYEVRVGDYKSCVDAEACTYDGGSGTLYTYGSGKENHPINGVTWQAAVDYCTFKGGRLPTEVEWEKAARGTEGWFYPWGVEEPTCDYAVMKEGGLGCGAGSTWEVGQKPEGVSPYGAHDMSGNVAEWTSSWLEGSPEKRVLRGGSFINSADGGLLTASDNSKQWDFDKGHYIIGFRCAR